MNKNIKDSSTKLTVIIFCRFHFRTYYRQKEYLTSDATLKISLKEDDDLLVLVTLKNIK